MGLKWYLASTEPRAEYMAAQELTRDGFEIFFPRVKTPHPRPGHSDEPLFPGYVFIRCEPESDGWPYFRPVHRVLSWVRFGGEIPSIPNEVVEELSKRVTQINDGEGLWQRFRRGERVRVASGNIDSIGVVVHEPKSPLARATILMEFLGRLVRTEVPWKSLRPLEGETVEVTRRSRRTRGRGRWVDGFGARASVGA